MSQRKQPDLGRRPVAASIGVLAVTWALSGCGADQPSNPDPPPITGNVSRDEDRLRALPYLGFSETKAEEGRSGVVVFDPQRSYPGYTLYSNRNLCSAELVDARGRIVHAWRAPPCHHWVNCEILPDGDLLLTGMDAIEQDERPQWFAAHFAMRLTWDGDVVWKRRIPAHHDIEVTPHRQLLTLTMQFRLVPSIHPTVETRDNLLSLLSLDGQIVEELSFYELFSPARADFTLKEIPVVTKHGRDEIDLFHANSVEWMHRPELQHRHPIYGLGNVLVCIRHQDSIAVIDWDDRQVIWAWGQGEISGPHDATVLENGNILLFDNGLSRRWSRVIELDPIGRRIVWEYTAKTPEDFFTVSRGANQRLGNGNTLITNSDSGQVFEVTPEGEIVWELLNPNRNDEGYPATIVRAKRYETAFIESLQQRFGDS